MTSAIAALLAESTTENSTPEPVVLGLVAFGTFLLALFIVSRFNKDR
jgi:hypothetical protein